MSSLLRTVEDHDALRVFADVLRGSGLAGALESRPCTLFAPTDDAFAELPWGELAELLASPPRLAGLLARHAAPGCWSAAELLRAGRVALLCGHVADVMWCDGLLLVRGEHHPDLEATVVRPDLPAGKGLLHLLDTVL